MKTIIINENDSDQRLDKFLTKKFKSMPTSLLYKYLRTKRIKVNEKKEKGSYILQKGDLLTMFISEEFFGKVDNQSYLKTLKPKIDVVFEDENVLVIDKPAGLIVHSDINEEYNTLINHITAYLYNKGDYDPERENSFAPALCNRIDRNTRGLVIAAKNSTALKSLNEIFRKRELSRYYIAAVHGTLPKTDGRIDNYLVKDKDKNKVYVKSSREDSLHRRSITNYRVIGYNKKQNLSLLSLELVTGRTHQIRVHMAHIGNPLLGDAKYSMSKKDKELGFSHQALCAYSIRFELKDKDGPLYYLNGLEFKAREPDFVKRLFDQELSRF